MKLNLNELHVTSFVTELDRDRIQGGLNTDVCPPPTLGCSLGCPPTGDTRHAFLCETQSTLLASRCLC